VPHGDGNAAGWRLSARLQQFRYPLFFSKRKNDIGHDMTLAGIIDEIGNIILGVDVAQKDQRALIEDMLEPLAIIGIPERA
jgi:hypothetical protein